MKIFMLLVAALLSGCATQKMADLPQQTRVEAAATFKKLGFEDWAGKPFVRTEALCGAERVNIEFSEIKHAIFSLRQSKLLLGVGHRGLCAATQPFSLKDADDAVRLVGAANSLGAVVTHMITVD